MCIAVHIYSALIGRRNSEVENAISVVSDAAPRRDLWEAYSISIATWV
jgi:hypothetical protein